MLVFHLPIPLLIADWLMYRRAVFHTNKIISVFEYNNIKQSETCKAYTNKDCYIDVD